MGACLEIEGLQYSITCNPINLQLPQTYLCIKFSSKGRKQKVLQFQCSWFQHFPWIHYCSVLLLGDEAFDFAKWFIVQGTDNTTPLSSLSPFAL